MYRNKINIDVSSLIPRYFIRIYAYTYTSVFFLINLIVICSFIFVVCSLFYLRQNIFPGQFISVVCMISPRRSYDRAISNWRYIYTNAVDIEIINTSEFEYFHYRNHIRFTHLCVFNIVTNNIISILLD